ncbi:MAG TPA: DUF1634 domain-containing protein [Bryobacteraceae bacterium]|nr:DUF1634 domain-containing protein [Bryobacteraceae bacterium]
MPQDSSGLSAEKMDLIVGDLLRAGVGLSAAIVLAGGLIYLVRHGTEAPGYHVFRGEPADLRTIGGIFRDAVALRGRGIIQLGLLLLIATPVARVAYLVYAFGRQGDRLYAAIALIVLVLLAYGLTSGQT